MKMLGLIPARGGSRRLPGKNIADLGGKPLIAWTIETATASGVFDEVAVSSDSPEILDVADRYGAKTIERPGRIARDDTPSLPVVTHALHERNVDAVMLLQPTSPFRNVDDIKTVADLLSQRNSDSVVSVVDAPGDLVFQIGHANRLRPEGKPLVRCNGAIYAITTAALAAGEDWYSGLAYAYRMPPERSLDIDTQFDLDIARMMLERKAA